MTKDELNNMMKEAGPIVRMPFDQWCERFANLVAAAQREADAKVCEAQKVGYPSYFEIDERIQQCADTIRARTTP